MLGCFVARKVLRQVFPIIRLFLPSATSGSSCRWKMHEHRIKRVQEMAMKVVGFKAMRVLVPMSAPLRWSMGVETCTDEGPIGIAETYGGQEIAARFDD